MLVKLVVARVGCFRSIGVADAVAVTASADIPLSTHAPHKDRNRIRAPEIYVGACNA
jgi:hypothetical protein